jgi:serine/threonine protein kinase
MREAALLAQISHPNIISLVGVCSTHIPIMVIMQYCERGSLLSFLHSHNGVNENELRCLSKLYILQDIASAMAYLSSKMVVHRDLAARNVLVNGDFVCKVRCVIFKWLG